MRLLDLTLGEPTEDVALDEALLQAAEHGMQTEVLRLWEPSTTFVVLGRSSCVADEVDVEGCSADKVPILRRASGGSAILAGPGSLMYALLLSLNERPALRMIDAAHRFVLETIADPLAAHVPGVERRGTSDLAIGDRKFSGNSMRLAHDSLLYHGTVLYDFPIETIGRYLNVPPRRPNYRGERDHADFVRNLPLPRETIRQSIITAFAAHEKQTDWPSEAVAELVAKKYSQRSWNFAL